jgi:hypothetical protein
MQVQVHPNPYTPSEEHPCPDCVAATNKCIPSHEEPYNWIIFGPSSPFRLCVGIPDWNRTTAASACRMAFVKLREDSYNISVPPFLVPRYDFNFSYLLFGFRHFIMLPLMEDCELRRHVDHGVVSLNTRGRSITTNFHRSGGNVLSIVDYTPSNYSTLFLIEIKLSIKQRGPTCAISCRAPVSSLSVLLLPPNLEQRPLLLLPAS